MLLVTIMKLIENDKARFYFLQAGRGAQFTKASENLLPLKRKATQHWKPTADYESQHQSYNTGLGGSGHCVPSV